MIFITKDLPKSNPKTTINNEIIPVYAYLFNFTHLLIHCPDIWLVISGYFKEETTLDIIEENKNKTTQKTLQC